MCVCVYKKIRLKKDYGWFALFRVVKVMALFFANLSLRMWNTFYLASPIIILNLASFSVFNALLH